MEFNWQPREVPEVSTPYRRIKTKIPAPETVPFWRGCAGSSPGHPEPAAHPLARAEGFSIYDRAGNKWVDFTSGVLVANAGYKREKMHEAMLSQLETGVWHTFLLPTSPARFVEKLREVAPPGLDVVFPPHHRLGKHRARLEADAHLRPDPRGKRKIGIVCFEGAFHGRTLGAQQIGGTPYLKEWIVNLDPDIHMAPFPRLPPLPCRQEGYAECEDECFGQLLSFLGGALGGRTTRTPGRGDHRKLPGGEARFMPKGYVERLAEWCRANQILLTFDEVQAGLRPDGQVLRLRALRGGARPYLLRQRHLRLPALVGRHRAGEIMRQFPPGALTNTHSGNPISCAASLAHLELILEEDLVSKAQALEAVLREEAEAIARACPDIVWPIRVRGLVGAIGLVEPNTKKPAVALAFAAVQRAVEKGLMLFAPVGPGPATIKINPPLIITERFPAGRHGRPAGSHRRMPKGVVLA